MDTETLSPAPPEFSWLGRFRDRQVEAAFQHAAARATQRALQSAVHTLALIYCLFAFSDLLSLSGTELAVYLAHRVLVGVAAVIVLRRLARAPVPEAVLGWGYGFLFAMSLVVAVVVGHHPSVAMDHPVPVFLPVMVLSLWLVDAGPFRLSLALASFVSIATLISWFGARELPLPEVVVGTAMVVAANIAGLLIQRRSCRAHREAWASLESERTTRRALAASRERAEAAVQAKSDFLATMSHELRTPMGGVQGLLGLLRETPLDGHQRQLVDTAWTATATLLNLVDGVLDLAKMEAGSLSPVIETVDIPDLMNGVVALLRGRAAQKGIHLQATTPPALPPRVNTDPVCLRQILFNLVGNAVKFTERGSVIISATPIAAPDGGLRLRFDVVDTGIGIPADRRDRLFQDFVQGDDQIGRRYGGTGLGLAICRRLVSVLGGRLGVESNLDAGSRFWFEIPVEAADQLAPGDGPQAQQLEQKLRILLAEDDPLNGMVLKTVLTKGGHEVVHADHGQTALHLAATECFDAVLMDVQLLGMDGLTATRNIRALPAPHGRVPILGLSAMATSRDRLHGLQAGMDDYLTKPTPPDALMAAIARAVQDGPERSKPTFSDKHTGNRVP